MCELNGKKIYIPIDWLPIFHSSGYISQENSLPSLSVFQSHHTAQKDYERHKNVFKDKIDILVVSQEQKQCTALIQSHLASLLHNGYKHKSHLSFHRALTMLQGRAYIYIIKLLIMETDWEQQKILHNQIHTSIR